VLRPLLFALLCLIWGSTWLIIKVGYGGLGPFNIAAVRFFVAGAVLAPLVPRWPRARAEWGLIVFVGVVLFGADYGLIYWAEQWLDSGLTAMIFAVLPVMTSLAAHVYLKTERLTARTLVATAAAFAGVVALFADRVAVDKAQLWPMVAILASAACATVANLATKRYGAALHPAALNAPAMLVGAVVLAAAGVATGETLRLPADRDLGCGDLSRHRRQRRHLPHLLLAPQDVECDDAQFHCGRDAARCRRARISVPGRAGNARHGRGGRADSRERGARDVDARAETELKLGAPRYRAKARCYNASPCRGALLR
jgi:hypothetical protein